MSDLSAAIYSILTSDSDVFGETSTRIRPDALDQNETLPAITYWRVSGVSINEINGSVSGLARARVTIECYAGQRDEANQLAEYVRLAMINARGTYSGTKVRNCLMDTHQQHYTENPIDGNSFLRYVTAQDFMFHYVEDV
jgi:hypothetical protein